MSFSDWHENENLIQRLKQMIRLGHLFHGCLFEGSPKDTERLDVYKRQDMSILTEKLGERCERREDS